MYIYHEYNNITCTVHAVLYMVKYSTINYYTCTLSRLKCICMSGKTHSDKYLKLLIPDSKNRGAL